MVVDRTAPGAKVPEILTGWEVGKCPACVYVMVPVTAQVKLMAVAGSVAAMVITPPLLIAWSMLFNGIPET